MTFLDFFKMFPEKIYVLQVVLIYLRGLLNWEMPQRVSGVVKCDNKSEVSYDFYVLPKEFWNKISGNKYPIDVPWENLTKSQKLNQYKKVISDDIKMSSKRLVNFANHSKEDDWLSKDVELLYQAYIHRTKIGDFQFYFVRNKFELFTQKEVRENKLDLILS